MNEEQFRGAIRSVVEAHIERLRITYSVLMSTAGLLQRLAREGGVDEVRINEVVTEEVERVKEAMDDMVQPPAARAHHRIH